MILGRSLSSEQSSISGYGGGGALHFSSYIEGLGFEKALVPSWAAAFSAFGCACSDYAFRYDQQLDFPLSPKGAEAPVLARILNDTWKALKAKVESEIRK